MNRSRRMQRIAMISRRDERNAARSLSDVQAELENLTRQRRELEAYREEYRASLRSGSAAPMNGAEVQKIRAFIHQVDGVVDALNHKIRQLEQRRELAREAWMQVQRRANALDGVAGRELKIERSLEETRSQREIDDRVRVKLR